MSAGYLSDPDKQVLFRLHDGVARNLYTLLEQCDLPLFSVRASLKALKRQRMVIETLTSTRHDWTITGLGIAYINSELQLELDRVRS